MRIVTLLLVTILLSGCSKHVCGDRANKIIEIDGGMLTSAISGYSIMMVDGIIYSIKDDPVSERLATEANRSTLKYFYREIQVRTKAQFIDINGKCVLEVEKFDLLKAKNDYQSLARLHHELGMPMTILQDE